MAPDFERLARTPWPIASLASSGIKAFNSAFERSCSRKACGYRGIDRQTPPTSLRHSYPQSALARSAASAVQRRTGEGARRFRRSARTFVQQ